MKKRIVSHSQVLGTSDGHTFKLVKGEVIEVYDRNKYNQVQVVIQGKPAVINGTMLDRIANDPVVVPMVAYPEDTVDVHYYDGNRPIMPGPLCGSLTVRGAITKDRNRVTCEKCLEALKEK